MVRWDWDSLKKDIEEGVKEGLAYMKQGAKAVGKKTSELTAEGKRQYRILELKAKIQKSFCDLGSRVYGLMASGAKNPATDAGVKDLVARIRKFEIQAAALGGTPKAKKKASKKKAARR